MRLKGWTSSNSSSPADDQPRSTFHSVNEQGQLDCSRLLQVVVKSVLWLQKSNAFLVESSLGLITLYLNYTAVYIL